MDWKIWGENNKRMQKEKNQLGENHEKLSP